MQLRPARDGVSCHVRLGSRSCLSLSCPRSKTRLLNGLEIHRDHLASDAQPRLFRLRSASTILATVAGMVRFVGDVRWKAKACRDCDSILRTRSKTMIDLLTSRRSGRMYGREPMCLLCCRAACTYLA